MKLFAKNNKIDMLTAPLFKKMVLFALPVLFTNVLQLLYNHADQIVVGQYNGTTAFAAIGSTSSLIHLVINVFMGIAVGVNVAVAHKLGANKTEDAEKILHTAVIFAVISGVAISVIGVLLSTTFLRWMKSPEDVIDLSSTYLKIYFLGAPFSLLYNFCAAAMRAKGQSQKPLTFLTISGAANVILNLFFVIVCNLSVAGVAIATVISQALSAVLAIISLSRDDGGCRLSLKKLKFDGKSFAVIAKIGFPAGIQSSVFSISNVLIQSTINSYGSVVMAGNTAAQNVESYLNAAAGSIYQSELAFIGQNYGAKRPKNIKKIIFNAFSLMVGTMAVLSLIVILFDDTVLKLFNPDPSAIEAAKIRLSINCGFYVLYGCMELAVGIMRGLGHGVTPMLVALAGVCGTRLLWLFFVYPIEPSLTLLYASYPVSWGLAMAAHLISFLIVRKKTFAKMNTTQTDI